MHHHDNILTYIIHIQKAMHCIVAYWLSHTYSISRKIMYYNARMYNIHVFAKYQIYINWMKYTYRWWCWSQRFCSSKCMLHVVNNESIAISVCKVLHLKSLTRLRDFSLKSHETFKTFETFETWKFQQKYSLNSTQTTIYYINSKLY